MATSIITLPQARIPLANVVINGASYPVQISMEWMLTLQGLLDRSGGTTSVNVVDALQELSIGQRTETPEPMPQFDVAPVYEPLALQEPADGRLHALEAQVAFLTQRINDFAQGYQI